MAKKWILTIFILIFIFGNINFVFSAPKKVEIYFFSSATCPHCAKEREFLKSLGKKYPETKIKEYEVISHPKNQKILDSFYKKYQVPKKEMGWVPITFISDKHFIGFSEQIGKDIENYLKESLGKLSKKEEIAAASKKIKIPLLGNVNPSEISLPILTLVLGTLDGFNPCAMWVLVVLISLLLALKSRKKIALVGGIFIFAEGFLYFLFMTAWLNAFLWIRYVSLTRILIGAFGIGFGIWQIKEFATWKPNVCKVTSHSNSQAKIVERMKKVLESKKIFAVIFGIIVLAFGVNLIEFFCSAGFPVMYTRILALQNIGVFKHYLYLLFYNILYMADDILVFAVALFALRRFSFSDKYNKYSTLIAGFLIFVLGILLIFKPGLLMFG